MSTTPNRGYSEIPGSTDPNVPYRVNVALREVDADVSAIAKLAQGARDDATYARTAAQGALSPTADAVAAALLDPDGAPARRVAEQINEIGDASFTGKGKGRFHRQIDSVAFGELAVPADGNYLIPGMIDTIDGDFVLVYREGTSHDLSYGSAPGPLKRRISSDDGTTFGPAVTIADHSAKNTGDTRDPFLYRAPGERRIYLTYFVDEPGTALDGSWISYSDDDGETFSTPIQITTGSAVTPGGLRKSADGIWRMPIYSQVNGKWQAQLITAANPLGAWSAPIVVYGPPAADATEWDFVEVTPTNWIAGIRLSGSNSVITQSTDGGVTWAVPVALTTIGTRVYNGWAALRKTRDGRVWMFSRADGQRVIQLLDVDAPLVAANWAEPGGISGYLDASSGGFVGKYQPFLVGDTWVGCYMAETVASEAAEIRIGRIRDDALNLGYSFLPAFSGIPDGSTAGWQLLPVPDRVKVRSKGGFYRIRWQMRSYQPSGAISAYQIEIAINGVRRNVNAEGSSSTWSTQASNTHTVAGSGYDDSKSGIVWLNKGIHTIELMYYMNSATIGRMFGDRLLEVTKL